MTAPAHDWRLVPAAAAAWAGAAGGTAGLPAAPLWAAGGAAVLLGCWAWRSGRHWLVAALLVLLVVGGGAALRSAQLATDLPGRLAAQGAAADVRVRIVGDPLLLPPKGNRPALAIVRCELLTLDARGMRVSASQPLVAFGSGALADSLARVQSGAIHEFRGLLAVPDPGSPEAFVVRLRSLSPQLEPPGALDSFVNELRAGLRRATAHSPPEQAALLPSLVVGDTSAMSEDLREEFRVTALSHLSAVSGANLSLLIGAVLVLARGLGIRGWWVRVVSLACVGLFVVVCRSEPSVVRAAAMGLVAVSALGVGGGRRSLRNLALAVLCLMLLDPWLARSWGFVLSVAACFGIAVLSPGWITAMVSWLPRWLAEALAVPLAAQLATQPIIVALSGQVSVVGLLANVLVGPFVGPATVLGLAAMCLGWWPLLASGVAWAGGWCVQPILWVADVGASLPAAAWAWPATPVGLALVTVGCACLAGLLGEVVRRRWLSIALVVGLGLAGWVRPVPLGWPGPWQAVFCSVGQGDATVLRAGAGAAVLVDTGPEPTATLACLDSLGVSRIPLLVLSHYHADHVGGVAAVVARYRPDFLLVSALAEPAFTAQQVRDLAAEAGARVIVASAGQVFRVGDVTWTTVAAGRPRSISAVVTEGESGAENDASVVGLADVSGLRVLLPGDREPAGQRTALADAAAHGLDLSAHVLKLPHHGSSRQEADFFTATGASLAVASAGLDNDYGHPSAAALRLATGQGMAIARTDQQGSIAISLDEAGLGVVTASD